jgi:hypothetical protein
MKYEYKQWCLCIPEIKISKGSPWIFLQIASKQAICRTEEKTLFCKLFMILLQTMGAHLMLLHQFFMGNR